MKTEKTQNLVSIRFRRNMRGCWQYKDLIVSNISKVYSCLQLDPEYDDVEITSV